MVPAVLLHSFPTSSSLIPVTLAIGAGTYLAPGSAFTISIANATVTSPAAAAGMVAAISPLEGSVQVPVPDQLANIAVGFTTESLVASVNEG